MPNFKQLFKYRPFVISLHIIAWVCFLFMPFFLYRIQILHTGFFVKELIDNLFLIGLFYLNIYVLIPKFFNQKKIGIYLSSMVLLVVFITLQQVALDYYMLGSRMRPGMAIRISKLHDLQVTSRKDSSLKVLGEMRNQQVADAYVATPAQPASGFHVAMAADTASEFMPSPMHRRMRMFEMGEKPSFWDFLLFPETLRRSGFFALLMLFMSGFIKIAQEWFRSEKQREELKVEKLNAELKFLKSQINPHFLFNCLNTIYSLAHKRSDQTEHAILKLSTIMRYMIYDANVARVRLEQELKYLSDYIDIQRLRLPKDIAVSYNVHGSTMDLVIEPMLLVPFVENAFKHGISYAEPSFINIDISIEVNMIRLIVKNSHFKERVAERGGIGLQNVMKRLELLYPDDHHLDIRDAGNEFIVDLKLLLKK
ncbi:sensor histidine kinase [Chitinophaga sp. sic0106]|uniref:sensor histidine kinase n=1 Tax=Chitinophaga sp. sic0106 TaxID=2854785 RepID=UPI001C4688AF|nr:histidine kinase [Chitinophaga sp. sic0106]MBV7531857.1 histidine kinase [Chitinophaga sp. sic0106]